MATERVLRAASLTALVTAASLVLATLPAQAQAQTFEAPQQLPRYVGGEPSITFDPTASGDVYVVAPQSAPAAFALLPRPPRPDQPEYGNLGAAFWYSRDGGRTWDVKLAGSTAGGGDTDVEVDDEHTVYVSDLQFASAAICRSYDRGVTFSDCDSTGLTRNEEGVLEDRPWISRGTRPNELYLTYHSLGAGVPVVERSTDGGATFVPCGSLLDPSGPAAPEYRPFAGTVVSKPVIGPDGSIYVEFVLPDSNGYINHLYMAVARGGCDGEPFENHVIYVNPEARLGNIFQFSALDGGGNLYVVAAGRLREDQPPTSIWVFSSHDGGRTWTVPQEPVNPPELKANMLPAIVAGQAGDEVLVGWFGTETSADTNNADNLWRYYAATSFSGGETWDLSTVSPTPMHYGGICTGGETCGRGSNRNLLEFSSAALDPATGCAAIALPGDPFNVPGAANSGNAFAYVSRQTGGRCLTATGRPTRAPGSAPHNTVCGDRVAPRSSVSRRRLGASRRRLALNGRSIDRVCTTGTRTSTFRGAVAKVGVIVWRRHGEACRFLTERGRLTERRACARRIALPARRRYLGSKTFKTYWSFRARVRLPPGRYFAVVRGTDDYGHVETRRRRSNRVSFVVR